MTQIRTFINREASGHEGWHKDVTWLVTTALGVFQHLPTLLAQRLKILGQIPGPTNGVHEGRAVGSPEGRAGAAAVQELPRGPQAVGFLGQEHRAEQGRAGEGNFGVNEG